MSEYGFRREILGQFITYSGEPPELLPFSNMELQDHIRHTEERLKQEYGWIEKLSVDQSTESILDEEEIKLLLEELDKRLQHYYNTDRKFFETSLLDRRYVLDCFSRRSFLTKNLFNRLDKIKISQIVYNIQKIYYSRGRIRGMSDAKPEVIEQMGYRIPSFIAGGKWEVIGEVDDLIKLRGVDAGNRDVIVIARRDCFILTPHCLMCWQETNRDIDCCSMCMKEIYG